MNTVNLNQQSVYLANMMPCIQILGNMSMIAKILQCVSKLVILIGTEYALQNLHICSYF